MSKQATFEIILGTYEEYLLGYHFIAKQTEIVQSFAAHDHSSSIRSIASSGNFLASGGADDRIFIYDLKARKEHCMLTHHDSTISCLEFTSNHSHIISGSTDGVLAIVRTGNWQLEKIWDKAHKGSAILDIAVHSSGKLALTLGSDCTLRTWNLVKGRQAYIINLQTKSRDAKSLEKIVWAPDGVHFVIYGGKTTEVWSIETGGIVKNIDYEQKVCSCIWQTDDNLIVGLEDGHLVRYNIEDAKMKQIKAHESRVKALRLFNEYLVSASSSGELKIWNENLDELARHETGCRITCLCILPIKTKKEESTNEEIETTITTAIPKTKVKTHVVVEVEESDDELVEIVKSKKQKTVIEDKEKPKKKRKKDTEALVTNKKQKLDSPSKNKKQGNKKKRYFNTV